MTNRTGVEIPVNLPSEEITLLIEDNKLIQSQKEDKFCKNILNMLANNKLHKKICTTVRMGFSKDILTTISRDLRSLYCLRF